MSLICRPRLTSCQASASWSVESPEGNMLTANALRMCLKRKAGRTLLQIYLCVSYAVQRLFFLNDLLKQSLVVDHLSKRNYNFNHFHIWNSFRNVLIMMLLLSADKLTILSAVSKWLLFAVHLTPMTPCPAMRVKNTVMMPSWSAPTPKITTTVCSLPINPLNELLLQNYTLSLATKEVFLLCDLLDPLLLLFLIYSITLLCDVKVSRTCE